MIAEWYTQAMAIVVWIVMAVVLAAVTDKIIHVLRGRR